ncbi:hypothetical protein EPUS_05973 [Endocarpon pusillum Z07020]|uniref:Uncharacterized protein n=1 Tax=Endocarpon pusillum (strain Z07020 / HMAS-L-300199) TaxID=1263415 RepID=U1HQ21_ENDPU|nr:uncharacterized protein EPUS_05973 [Endocarpon pusillum Z07020]ERF71144.1 hypothetical protein EPUS_05973 [Endocarpon pusillum Z07020]
MPSWTAENDLKLASAIIALHQVKVSKDDCERLATIIGEDCTAKAITHRVAKFREAATKLGLAGGGDAAAAAAAAATPGTPATGKKRARKTKGDEDQDGDGVPATPTKKPRTPKTKKSSAVAKDDVEQEEERVKEEPLDEEQLQADA